MRILCPDPKKCKKRKYHNNKKNCEIYNAKRKDFYSKNKNKAPVLKTKEMPLKEMNCDELSEELLLCFKEKTGLDSKNVANAIELAHSLHLDQKRRNRGEHDKTPYIEHPLRCSIRLLRMGVKDESVIVSSILHDSIEDCAQKFSLAYTREKFLEENKAREIFDDFLLKKFGSKVSCTIKGVTNPIQKEKISKQEKRDLYRENLAEKLQATPQIFLVKYSDFADNAGGLHHNYVDGFKEKTYNQALKYISCVELFEENLENHNLEIPQSSIELMRKKLARTRKRLQAIIKDFESSQE